VKQERSVLLLTVAVALAGLLVIGLVIGLVVLLDPIP
jgi:hypothetical protein